MKSLLETTKKAQVQSMAPAIIALMIAAVFLVLGIIIMSELRDTDIVATSNAATVINETLTTMDSVNGERVARGPLDSPFGNFVVDLIINASNDEVITSGNYSYSPNGTILYVESTHQGYNNSDWEVTYSYTFGGESYDSANKTVVGLGTFADFWTIIVLAIVITIVIGMLLVVFGRRSNR